MTLSLPEPQGEGSTARVAGLVAVGGAAGAGLRHLAIQLVPGSTTVLVLNVVGSLVLGILLVSRPARWFPLVATGVCGGLTTFATFALDVAERLDHGDLTSAATLAGSTTIGAVAAATVGRSASRHRRPRPVGDPAP